MPGRIEKGYVLKVGKRSVLAFAILLLCAAHAMAGAGPRNISTQGALGYLGGGGRYAETEDADTPIQNPAGAAFMDDGVYIHLSAMITFPCFSIKDVETGKEYDNPSSGELPAFAVTYKKDKYAIFTKVTVPGGQGGGTWEPSPQWDYTAQSLGSNFIASADQDTEFYGYKVGYSIGGGLQLSDKVSVGLSITALNSIQTYESTGRLIDANTGVTIGELKTDYEGNGWGYGMSLSVLYTVEKLKIGLRFDPEVSIKVKRDIKAGDNTTIYSYDDGSKFHDDYPAIFMTSATYQYTPKLKIGGGFVYVWQKGLNGDDQPYTDEWNNGWELQSSAEYALKPDWELLVGINYVNIGIPNSGFSYAEWSFKNGWTFSLGAQWRSTPRWSFILGIQHAIFPDENLTEAPTVIPIKGGGEQTWDTVYENSAGDALERTQVLIGLEYKIP